MLRLTVLGVTIEVIAVGDDVQHLEDRWRDSWAWCLASDSAVASTQVRVGLGNDENLDVRSSDPGQLSDLLTSTVTRLAISQQAGQLLMLHAAACADPGSGRSVILVGPSGRGKTTAASALGRQFIYLTDETAAIRMDDTIVPFPKPLSVVDPQRPGRKRQLNPASVGMLPPTGVFQPRTHAIALLHREPGAGFVALEPIPLIDAIFELAEQTSSLHLLPYGLHRLLALLTLVGGVYRLSYGDAEQLMEPVRALLAADVASARAASWSAATDIPLESRRVPGSLRRDPRGDAAMIDGEVVILQGPRLFKLGPIGAHIWRSTADWVAPVDLDSELRRAYGPGLPRRRRTELVDELISAGVLIRDETAP